MTVSKPQIMRHWEKFNPYEYGQPDTFFLGRDENRTEYSTQGFSFDIETTSTIINGEKKAWCYHFQFGFENSCYYGRNLKDFKDILDDISIYLGDRHIICWVHNLSYEFGFLTEYLHFDNIFATAPNHPIKCSYKNIEFRCSYAFSNMSLALLSNTYTITKKGVGDLDYGIIRYPNTPLNVKEKMYCFRDVKILTEYWYMHILPMYIIGKKRKWLPLTNTAKVRHDMQSRISSWKEYKAIYSSVYPTEKMYNILRKCFYGGIVRANANYFSKLLDGIASRDRTSSYPAVQLDYLYPMGRFIKIKISDYNDYSDDEYCKLLNVTFFNLTTDAPVSIMPFGKAKCSSDVLLDNGRINRASVVTLWCTSVDFDLWKKFYKGSVKINECYVSKKGRLCRFQIESLLEYFVGKSELKHVPGMEEVYLKLKNMLNSNYGCCVQKHNDESLIYNYSTGAWDKEPIEYSEQNSEFLLYQVGVFITTYARYELLRAVYAIWQDDVFNNRKESAIVYMDTDSCKYRYRGGVYEYIFDKLDRDIITKTVEACDHYGIECTDTIKTLGTWELETYDKKTGSHTYKSFITLGSKRYLHDGVPTVSGLPKNGFYNYCKNHNLKPEEAFRCGTYFSEYDINKVAMTYMCAEDQCVVTNDGESFLTPKHFVHAQQVGFKLDISKDYRSFINDIISTTGKRGNSYD